MCGGQSSGLSCRRMLVLAFYAAPRRLNYCKYALPQPLCCFYPLLTVCDSLPTFANRTNIGTNAIERDGAKQQGVMLPIVWDNNRGTGVS